MNQKGFSLIEVLVSLMLVFTVALTLLQQQDQTRQILTQLVLMVGASQYLDQVEESLFVNGDKISAIPTPYLMRLKKSRAGAILRIAWLDGSHTITRKHRQMAALQ